MDSEQEKQLFTRLDALASMVDHINANLLLRTEQIHQLREQNKMLIAAFGASDPDTSNLISKLDQDFDEAVRKKLHRFILETGEQSPEVASHLQRILDARGILPDEFGIGQGDPTP